MAYARFRPCPHCKSSLSFLEGVSGSSMTPHCPTCHAVVPVTRATFLMKDQSRLSLTPVSPPTPVK